MDRRRSLSRFAAASLLVAAGLAAGTASGQQGGGGAQGADDAKIAARTLGKEGQDALDRKQYAVAAEKFAQADHSYHAPTLVLGLARAQAGLGKLVAAQEAYERVLREGAPPGSPAPFVQAVDDSRRESAALSARIPTVVIDVVGPRAPEVLLDGLPLPATALGTARPIDPGEHHLQASASGFAPVEQRFSAVERVAGRVTLRLALVPVASAPQRETPAPAAAPPSPSRFPFTPLGVTALSLGAAGLIVGGITGGLAIGKHSELKGACPQDRCPTNVATVKTTLDSYHTLGTISTIGFIAGGVLAAGGITLLIVAPRSASSDAAPKAGWTPYLTLGGVGAAGRF